MSAGPGIHHEGTNLVCTCIFIHLIYRGEMVLLIETLKSGVEGLWFEPRLKACAKWGENVGDMSWLWAQWIF